MRAGDRLLVLQVNDIAFVSIEPRDLLLAWPGAFLSRELDAGARVVYAVAGELVDRPERAPFDPTFHGSRADADTRADTIGVNRRAGPLELVNLEFVHVAAGENSDIRESALVKYLPDVLAIGEDVARVKS